MSAKPVSSMTCEQIYQIWSTEPDLIKIYDLRPEPIFESGHIPGAVRIAAEEVENYLLKLNGKLAVLVVEDHLEEKLRGAFEKYDDVVVLKKCERWQKTLNLPVSGQSVAHILSSLQAQDKNLRRDPILFQQFYDTQTSAFSYLIADPQSKEAAVIDPSITHLESILETLRQQDLRLMYTLATRQHPSFFASAEILFRKTGAKTGAGEASSEPLIDVLLEDGQEFSLGSKKVTVVRTLEAARSGFSFYFEGFLFIGDGSVVSELNPEFLILPEETKICPGYKMVQEEISTIGELRTKK